MKQSDSDAACAAIREKSAIQPRVGIVLGSGLGSLSDDVMDAVAVPYSEIPEFPQLTVAGHSGDLVLGMLSGVPVALLAGRKHFYEARDAKAMNLPLLVLKDLGCEVLLLSNASGGITPGLNPGSIAVLCDHINTPIVSPLTGEDFIEDKFIDMKDCYDPALRSDLIALAKEQGFDLSEAVYAFWAGPQFETPAEIRALRSLGADVVGMSTVLEVIFARALGLRVAALSVITNRAAGLDDGALSHAQTQQNAKLAEAGMKKLVGSFVTKIGGAS